MAWRAVSRGTTLLLDFSSHVVSIILFLIHRLLYFIRFIKTHSTRFPTHTGAKHYYLSLSLPISSYFKLCLPFRFLVLG